MIEAVIFDIDGTILDSVDLHAKAWQEAFSHFGYDFTYDAVRSQIGKGGDQLLPFFLSERQVKRQGKEISDFRSSLFKEKYLPQIKPFEGVRELFMKIRGNAQQIALASSAKGDELKVFERIANVQDLVGVETSSADAKHSKPYPDIFEAAVDRLGEGFGPETVIVVGDSPHDAEAARRAKLKTVGVLCGGFAEADLRQAGCLAIYKNPQDLLNHYEDSPLARTAKSMKA